MDKRLELQFQGFLTTPPLWFKNDLFNLHQFEFPRAPLLPKETILAGSPSLLTNFVLGKRAESFFELALTHSDRFQVIAQNIQIQREKITLGEIDFLIEDTVKNRQLHIELVCKFYVYDPSFENELERWIGPNRKDTLLQKTEKLMQKQLPLLYKPETEPYLSGLNLQSEKLQQEVCFKANLFIPKNLENKEFKHINNQCISGFWIHSEEFTEIDYGRFQFLAPKKQDWSIAPKYGENWVSYSKIKESIGELILQKKSPLIWIRKNKEEFEHLFVVWW